MNKLFLILAIVCIGFELYAQTGKSIDPYDPIRIKYKLSHALSNAASEPDASLSIINEAIRDAENAKDKATLFEGLCTKTHFFLVLKQFDDALITANQVYLIAIDSRSETNTLQAIKILAEVHIAKDIKEEMLDYLYQGYALSKQLKDTLSISYFLIVIPEVEVELGNVSRAMQYSLAAKEFFEECNDSLNLAKTLITLGVVHCDLGNYSSAKVNIDNALHIFKELNDSLMVGKSFLSLTNLFIFEDKLEEAEISCTKALSILERVDKKEFFKAKSILAEVFIRNGNYHKAAEMLDEVLSFQQSIDDINGLSLTYLRYGNLYLKTKKPQLAVESFGLSISKSQTAGSINLIRQAYKGLSEAYNKKKDFANAFLSLQSYVSLTDSLYNLQKVSEASKLEEKAEIERHENEILEKEVELQRRKELINQQQQKQALLLVVMVLLCGIAIFAFREYRHKKKANYLLSSQKEELERQKKIAEKQTRDFTDSLNYAKRIQQAILRASLKMKEHFSESFLIFVPRELVSGDFYWFKEKNGVLLFALADCTGHGVPGAFMSIIGTYGLNRIVGEQNVTSPGEVLNQMNVLFKDSLEQQKGVEIFDGMDIALCAYNSATLELSYSGANIPLHICRKSDLPQAASHISAKNQSHILYQIRPNKQPVGSYFEKVNFITRSVKLMKDDIIYLYSDGFADQFGGPDGKKFLSTELRKLICNLADTPLDKQKGILVHTLSKWKGKRPQVDDVSFIGLKV